MNIKVLTLCALLLATGCSANTPKIKISKPRYTPTPVVYKKVKSSIIKCGNSKRESDLHALTCTIYMEARGEPIISQLMVANSVLSRHDITGASIKNIVYANKQFSWTNNKKILVVKDKNSWDKDWRIAQLAMRLRKDNLIANCYYYHVSSIHPKWSKKLIQQGLKSVKIGKQTFYCNKGISIDNKKLLVALYNNLE